MKEKSAPSVWNNCLEIIKDNVSAQSFKTWFEPIRPVDLQGVVLTIQVPSQFFYEWLEEHYVSLLRKTIKRELGNNARLEYRIVVRKLKRQYTIHCGLSKLQLRQSKQPGSWIPLFFNRTIKSRIRSLFRDLKKSNIDSQLNSNYNFDSYVEGDCNRLARSAGYAVAQKPGGTAFNPLVIYGGVGLGKTHIAQAIGNEVKANFPNKTVLYVSSEKFTNQFFDAVKNNSVNDFVHFYQLIDVLIVDDIQFFGNKGKDTGYFLPHL
jgi:chromosomal replication initiator protein